MCQKIEIIRSKKTGSLCMILIQKAMF